MVHRSCIAVPANDEKLFAKAALMPAEQILLDLEDSVAPDDKDDARRNLATLIDSVDYGPKALSVRINSLESGLATRDVITVVETCGHRLHSIVLPKVGDPDQLFYVDQLVSDLVTESGGRGDALRIDILLETADGIANAREILGAAGRVGVAVFGMNGYCRDVGITAPPAGDTLGVVGWAAAEVVNAASAAGIAAIAGPSRERADEIAYGAETSYLKAAGYAGRWCVHPRQVTWTNTVFAAA